MGEAARGESRTRHAARRHCVAGILSQRAADRDGGSIAADAQSTRAPLVAGPCLAQPRAARQSVPLAHRSARQVLAVRLQCRSGAQSSGVARFVAPALGQPRRAARDRPRPLVAQTRSRTCGGRRSHRTQVSRIQRIQTVDC